MKKTRIKISKLLPYCLMVLMVCAFSMPDSIKVQAASSMKNSSIFVGGTVTLKVTNASKKVKWSVNKPKIAKITKIKGKKKSTAVVKGKKAGKAVVTAKIGKKKLKATITVNAKPKPQPHVHSYTTPASCTQPAQCSCGLTYGSPLGHQMAPATCKAPQTCTRCGAKAGEAAPHNYSPTTSRCIWCNQLNLRDFVGFRVSRTANTGNYNVNYIYIAVANIGNVSFEILTNMPATIYPSAGAPGVRVYLTDTNDQTYTDANRFVVLPSSADDAWFDTLNNTTFTFAPEGVLEFYATYGEHTYLFRVNASKLDANGNFLLSDYTFTQIN